MKDRQLPGPLAEVSPSSDKAVNSQARYSDDDGCRRPRQCQSSEEGVCTSPQRVEAAPQRCPFGCDAAWPHPSGHIASGVQRDINGIM